MSTPEEQIAQSQRIVDLRQRMLANVANGKPSSEGITPDELREAINGLRANRMVAGARGGNAKAQKATKADTPASAETVKALDGKLAALGLDLD
jgi:hypothetical protein